VSDTVTLTIDGQPVTVAKGTNVLEAAKLLGIDISAFCYHPGLPIVAQCRQCLVSVEKNPKLQPSCQQVVGDGMVVHTTDEHSMLARKQQLEFTLVNHPIDCPICDKAGECTLQKLYFDHDNADSRVDTPKVHKPKVVDVGPHIVLDAERCILCSRCIRACDHTSGQHQLEFAHRGDHQVLTTAPGEQLDNPYSLNTVDVCPVGALTAKDFRFTMRAWAARPAATSRFTIATSARGGSCRATTPTSTTTGCATRAGSPTTACARSGWQARSSTACPRTGIARCRPRRSGSACS
jgi:NADH-quinone oxidoreductase subunit G